jgi:hypothetical protein
VFGAWVAYSWALSADLGDAAITSGEIIGTPKEKSSPVTAVKK